MELMRRSDASRCCSPRRATATLRATGSYRDQLIYERGGWYFTSRELQWDSVSNGHSLTV